MENKINVAELLRKCPEGMELDCTLFDKVKFEKCVGDAIYIRLDGRGLFGLDKSGNCFEFPDSKCVIFPKGKDTWEGFVPPCKFKDGDIVATRTSHYSWISIYKENRKEFNEDACYTYVDYEKDRKDFYVNDLSRCLVFDREIITQRLATEEERQELLQAIKGNGYKWDAERKCLIELPKFKNGDILAAGDWVFIFKELHTNGSPKCYCHYDLTLEEFKVDTNSYMACGGDIYLATKEQQDLLFSKMKGAGYKWNAETKTLISLQREWELVSKFDISTLNPFDKVLVRDSINDKWGIQFFEKFVKDKQYPFYCMGNTHRQCVPYKGNEHLLDTRDECSDYYKTWE